MATILNQYNEEKTWQMYLSIISNPLNQTKSFDDFREHLHSGNPVKQVPETMTKQKMQEQVAQAQNILNHFIPPVPEKE